MIGSIDISTLGHSDWFYLVVFSVLALFLVGVWRVFRMEVSSYVEDLLATILMLTALAGLVAGVALCIKDTNRIADARVSAIEKELGGTLVDGDVFSGGFLVIGNPDGTVRTVNSAITGDVMVFFEGDVGTGSKSD